MQEVEITVKVNGQVVKQQVEQVDGTLEEMEEKIDAMSRGLAAAALQSSVDAVTPNRPAFMVLSDKVLRDMARRCPRSESEMMEVRGVGKAKLAAYGAVFLDGIRSVHPG